MPARVVAPWSLNMMSTEPRRLTWTVAAPPATCIAVVACEYGLKWGGRGYGVRACVVVVCLG